MKTFQIIGYNAITENLLYLYDNELKKIKIKKELLPNDFDNILLSLTSIKFFFKKINKKAIYDLCRIKATK